MKLLAVAALLVLAAGCAAPKATESVISPAGDEPIEPVVTVLQLTGGVPLAVAGRPLVPPNPPVEDWALTFNVTNQTRLLRVSLAWNDPIGAQDLDVYAAASRFIPLSDDDPLVCNGPPTYADCLGRYSNPNGTYGAPDNPSVLTLTERVLRDVQAACGDPCVWYSEPWSKAAYANVTWTITVAVVDSPTPLPAGYVLPEPAPQRPT
jgi:hypothetical protein